MMRGPIDRMIDRYDRDPVFRHYVDSMRRAIVHLELSPSELREAAMLAAFIEESQRPIRFVTATGSFLPLPRNVRGEDPG